MKKVNELKGRFGVYGIGDYKSKIWYIYDRLNHWLVSGQTMSFKTKKEAYEKAFELNKGRDNP